ncbi:NtrY-like histidine kinase [Orientia tsutsugamushi str. Boryong]|uniref:histidine kinase n=1 Tax=Orientia tsutsugamushi (strain Boryong) TaxID=357244 RepID=A5CE77_ORITB|nr:NtrY-like histidine kinase [Orientia tsutsugamushi str. Boryong]
MATNNKISNSFKKTVVLYCIYSLILLLNSVYFFIVFFTKDYITYNSKFISYSLLLDFTSLLIIIILLAKVVWKYLRYNVKTVTERLQQKVAVTFSITAVIPIIALAVLFIFFFNFAIQNYFDQYINKIFCYSSTISRLYLKSNSNEPNTMLNIANELTSKKIAKLYTNTNKLWHFLKHKEIIDYLTKNFDSNQEYIKLKYQLILLQVKCLIAFLCIALLMLLIAIHMSLILANRIFLPVTELLVTATKSIKLAKLNIQLKHTNIENELDFLTSVFNQMIKQLEYQNKDLTITQKTLVWSDIARKVAHEINNPLTPIQLSASMLADKFGKEVSDPIMFTKYLNTISRHAKDIKTIIKEFADFAKIPVPKFTNCDLVAVIKGLVESRQIINEKIQYKFISTLSKLDFVADVTQIHQIIANLLNNAEESLESKFHSTKIIKIFLQQPVFEIVTIEVQDTGNGFSLDLINYITEPYVTTRLRGSGLGLSIVKKIVEDHFGTLQIRNLPNGGAAVQIIFDNLKLQTCLNRCYE